MILTKAAFLSHAFHALYWADKYQGMRDYVDKHMNCEDIAMQYVVAHEAKSQPVFLSGDVADLGVFGGISLRGNVVQAKHMDDRSSCLNDLLIHFQGTSVLDTQTPEEAQKKPTTITDPDGGVAVASSPFLKMPLIYSRLASGQYLSNQGPSTWFEWISSDLWNWE